MNPVRYRRYTFPKEWVPAVKCPTCKRSITGYFSQQSLVTGLIEKWLDPCMHQLLDAQEQALVTDLMKRGI